MITLPTIQQLANSLKAAIETQFGITTPTTGKSFLRAFIAVMAAKFKEYYLVIGNLQKNIFVDTADPEALGGTLERFGRVKIGRNPFPAQAAQYIITVTGTVGGVINAATTFKSDDSSLNPGFLFILDNAYTLTSSSGTITVRALTTGTISALNILDTLTATAPIALVNSGAYVTSVLVLPIDAEAIEDYRAAVLASYRSEPEGGAGVDYRLWSQDAFGVRFVYPYAKSGAANEINLFVEALVVDSIDGKGTPSATLLNTVESVVEFNPDSTLPLLERGRRPLGIFQVHYLPISIETIDINIPGLNATALQKAAITAAITAAINLIRPFVSSCDVLANKNDILDINKIIGIIITTQPGAIFSTPNIKVNGISLLTYTFTDGNIPYLNSVTYV